MSKTILISMAILNVSSLIMITFIKPDIHYKSTKSKQIMETIIEKKILDNEAALHYPYSLPELGYGYGSLEPNIDKETMEIHYTKHHGGYVNNLNNAIKDTELEKLTLSDILKNISKYSAAVRNNGGGHYNHTLFWQLISSNGGGTPKGFLLDEITKTFGSFEQFKNTFNDAATKRFGSGWAWLIIDENKKLVITSTPNQDNPLMDVSEKKGTPILALDVWEHAYYLKYQNRRAEYINAFWNVVNWEEVEKRYNENMNT